MPITLRSPHGRPLPLGDSTPYIEILSEDGKLAMLFIIAGPDEILRYDANSLELNEYARRFDVPVGGCTKLPDRTSSTD